ncbi:NADH-quinone oxidoreductase subunit L [Isosphaeraceae bacterium EP7]
MSWQVSLYVAAVLIPLFASAIQLLGIRWLGRLNATIATGAILTSFALSLVGSFVYFGQNAAAVFAGNHAAAGEDGHGEVPHDIAGHEAAADPKAGPAHDALATKAEPATPRPPHAGPQAWTAEFEWISLGTMALPGSSARFEDLTIPLSIHIDNLTVIVFVMVTFIATLVHLYSMAYMRGDPRYPRFFAYLSLFCFSMLGLVASGSIFMVFMFWELVGVCSYFLIGFWYEDKKNADAANKAFITNRVGDVGMLLGLGLLWGALGTFDIREINTTVRDSSGHLNETLIDGKDVIQLKDQASGEVLKDEATGRARQIPLWMLTLAGLGIFAGCVGKSAQFPLHVWLPDAMAGPTPVSALIHAATMVAAGVYLVGRFFPVFTDPALLYIAYTGGITLFIAATIAVVQDDYKKVLAYSTVSQLGFMMLGLGVGGWAAGLFHLITHACFKALLFLGAGSIYHSVHTYDMHKLGGLRPKMPVTALTMLLATCAISGVPLFSGFYSKDAILASALALAMERPAHSLLFVLPCVGAAITAFYMFRMWLLVFDGNSRSLGLADTHDAHGHHHHGDPVAHAHESEPLMSWPLIALAIPTVAIGWPWIVVPLATPVLEQMIAYGAPIPLHEHAPAAHWLAMVASLIVASLGIGGAFLFYSAKYKRYESSVVATRFAGVTSFLKHKWYFDELYGATLVRPCLALARGVAAFDKGVVDFFVNLSARLTLLLSRISGLFDRIMVDGLVNLTAGVVYALGDRFRSIQTGLLRNYLMVLAVGVIGLFAGVVAWVSG